MQVVVHEAKVVLPAVRAQDAPRRVVGDEELQVRHHGRVDAQAPRRLNTRYVREQNTMQYTFYYVLTCVIKFCMF